MFEFVDSLQNLERLDKPVVGLGGVLVEIFYMVLIHVF